MAKKLIFMVYILLILFLLCSLTLNAQQVKGGSTVTIAKDEVIEGDLFITGSVIKINGVVTGDLFFGCGTMTVNGEIKGDIIGMSQSFTLNGTANDDIRVWSQVIVINGSVEKSLSAFGEDVVISEQGKIKRDVFLGCKEARLEGDVFGKLKGGAENLQIFGTIGKQVKFDAKNIILHPESKIKDDFKYRAKKLEAKPGSEIEGETVKLPYKKAKSKWQRWSFYFFKVLFLIGTIIVGLLIMKFLPGLTKKTTQQIQSIWQSLGIGFLVLICLPVAAIIVSITIIGVPLAVILFVFYFLFLFLGKIFVSLVFGQKVLKLKENHSYSALILGLLIFTILFSVPYIGWLIKLLVVIVGLGALSTVSFQHFKKKT